MKKHHTLTNVQRALGALFVSLFLLASTASGQNVRFVDDDAHAGGNGLSWARAYTFLQDALTEAAAPGSGITEIRVGQGTYKPDRNSANPIGTGDELISFMLVKDVALKGGYAGIGTADPDFRNTATLQSFLSGDLAGDDLPNFTNTSDNSLHVVTAMGGPVIYSRSTLLEGFTIRDGHAEGIGGVADSSEGGGLFLRLAHITVSECIFTDNQSSGSGGGVYGENSTPIYINCVFDSNRSDFGDGGALFYKFPGTPGIFIKDCRFIDNFAGNMGGALYFVATGTIVGCDFIGNEATTFGGGVIMSNQSTVISSSFIKNKASRGGGIYFGGGAGGFIANVQMIANEATLFGGGIYVANSGILRIINSTISENTAVSANGGIYIHSLNTNTMIHNSILWGNNDPSGNLQDAQFGPSQPVVISYSCIEGWNGILGGIGNIGENPIFVDLDGQDNILGTEDDNLQLASGSPCIDSGDNTLVPLDLADLDNDGDTLELMPLSLDLQSRFSNDPNTIDSGFGIAPIVDMGAFEFHLSCPADTDGNSVVNVADLLALLISWGPCPAPCATDSNGDGSVNVADLLTLLTSWGACP